MRNRIAAMLLSIAAVLGVGVSLMAFAWPDEQASASSTGPDIRVCYEIAPGVDVTASEAMDVAAAAGFEAAAEQVPVGADAPLPAIAVRSGCERGLQAVPSLQTLKYSLGIVPEFVETPQADVHVYIVPQADVYASPFGAAGVIKTAYQRGCGADGCGPLATAVFVGR